MNLSQFWTLMREEFGNSYAQSVAVEQHITALGSRTPAAALEAGVSPKAVWAAVCDHMNIPTERRLGRDRGKPGPATPGATS